MNKSVFCKEEIDFTKEPLFLGSGRNVARLDLPISQWIKKRTEKALGLTWFPGDFSYVQDAKDFAQLTPKLQQLFLANLKFQTVLDSVATRTVAEVFLPITTNPQLEEWFVLHAFQESIHSASYADLIKALPLNSTKVFDEIMVTPEIMERAQMIVDCFDDTIKHNALLTVESDLYNIEDHNRSIIKSLYALNILEAGLFQTSFITTFAFGENGIMESSSKSMGKISADENNHYALTVYLINTLKKNSTYKYIFEELKPEIEAMYDAAAEADYMWIDYIFRDDARLLGLSKPVLVQYSDWNMAKARKAIGLSSTKGLTNPCTWADKYTNISNQQNANNESDSAAYLLGKIDKHVPLEFYETLPGYRKEPT